MGRLGTTTCTDPLYISEVRGYSHKYVTTEIDKLEYSTHDYNANAWKLVYKMYPRPTTYYRQGWELTNDIDPVAGNYNSPHIG